MSPSASTTEPSHESPYRRDEWWGVHEDDPTTDPAAAAAARADPNDPIRYIAYAYLREDTDALCTTTLTQPPWNGGRTAELLAWLLEDECIDGRAAVMHHRNREVELSEPCFHVPTTSSAAFGNRELTQKRHRARVNEETGYIAMGETTGVTLRDRPLPEFMETVDQYLNDVWADAMSGGSSRSSISKTDLQRARGTAKQRKRAGNCSDLEALEAAVREIRRRAHR